MKHIGILGGGPAALFLLKRLIEQNGNSIKITIIEKTNQLGAGMPYSKQGACNEHVTNVSGNEIPGMVTSVEEWVKEAPEHLLKKFNINENNFNDYKVLPRLFFGEYLSAQFNLLLVQAKENGIMVNILYNTEVQNVFDDTSTEKVNVITSKGEHEFDRVAICTGHNWQKKFRRYSGRLV